MWHYLKLLQACSILPCSTGTADQKRPNSPNNIFKPWLGTGIHWPVPNNVFAIFENFREISKKFRWWIRKKRFEFFQKTRFRSSLCRRIHFNRQADFTKNWWVIWFNSNCSSYWSRSSLLRKFNKISLRNIHYVIKMSLPDHILPDKIITFLTYSHQFERGIGSFWLKKYV